MLHLANTTAFIEIIKQDTVVVKFGADWCGPCRVLIPVFNKLIEKNPDVNFASVNIDVIPELTSTYDVSKIPAVLFFQNGQLKNKVIGAMSEAKYQEIIDGLKN